MPDLPLVLCGPIVRRVSADGVCVWVALSESRHVELLVFRRAEGESDSALVVGRRKTVELGPQLHVAAVHADAPPGVLHWGETYSYDLRFGIDDRWASVRGVLDRQGETATFASLCYPGEILPGFVLPSDQPERVRVAHGSCRKPHGKGVDALAILDRLIGDTVGGESSQPRPQQLFLTGDQIYADDVHPEVFRRIEALVPRLFGADREREVELAAHRDELQAGERGRFVERRMRFTSGRASCHLVSLAEYYTLYLLSWSDVLWRDDPPVDAALAGFRDTLPAVRRALANVATYMIFDDHDVTDDWNRSERWVQNVAESEHGRRVVRNGLASYLLFQHWGNAPALFARDAAHGAVLDALDGWDGTAGEKGARVERHIFVPGPGRALEPVPGGAIRFGYTLDTPLYRVVALDCRTRRRFARGPDGPPGLMSHGAIAEAFAAAPRGGPLTIVLSPTPVLGVGYVEAGQKVAAWVLGALGRETDLVTPGEKVDVEAWAFDPEIHEQLLSRLAQERRVIVLSGDVHYGFGASVTDREADAKILNFVSSALRNQVFAGTLTWIVGRAAALRRDRFLDDEAASAALPELEAPQDRDLAPGASRIGRFEDVPLVAEGDGDEGALEGYLGGSRPDRRRAEIVPASNLGELVLRTDEAVHTLYHEKTHGLRGRTQTVHRGELPLSRPLDK